MIQVKTFYAHNELRNYSYLLYDDETGESWAIDPFDSSPFIEFIKKNSLDLNGILNTHGHWDHVRGNDDLVATFKTSVTQMRSGEKISLSNGAVLETLDTPGHTLDHQVFILNNRNDPPGLFSGDTLFNAGVGNCRGGGDVNLLFETTKNLIDKLPTSTVLYPGHDYRFRNLEFAFKLEPDNKIIQDNLKLLKGVATESLPPVTLADEKMVNPFLRLESQELRENLSQTGQNEKEVFIKLRQLRDNW
jgi:hydroxyacylglutathione hydrolase